MGEVNVELFLENATDREMFKRGVMKDDDVRRLTTRAIVRQTLTPRPESPYLPTLKLK